MDIIREVKVADLFTIGNLVCGVLSIMSVLSENYTTAALFIIGAGIMDVFDGRVARMLKQTNVLGKQLDSLADLVSFGVAPAILAYGYGFRDLFAKTILLFFVACGMLRLARFNIQKIKGYRGMPITMNGLIFPLLYLFLPIIPGVLIYLYLISALLMISDIKIPKF